MEIRLLGSPQCFPIPLLIGKPLRRMKLLQQKTLRMLLVRQEQDVLAEISAAEDEEIIDDEAFERMVEQYTEPGMENDVNMDDEDDLLEEEMELDRQRKEREEKQRTATAPGSDGANLQKSKAAPESLGNRSLGNGEREEDERRKTFAASSQEQVTRQRVNGSTRVENDETGALTEKQLEKQMASTLKRKKISRSP